MSDRKYWIREMSWVEFDERRKETKTVIIPTGACEIYGPHLPMGSDGFAAEAAAEEVARRTGALIAPMTEVSDSSSLKDFVGTLSMSKELFWTKMKHHRCSTFACVSMTHTALMSKNPLIVLLCESPPVNLCKTNSLF